MTTKLVPPKVKKAVAAKRFAFLQAHINYLKSLSLAMIFLLVCLYAGAQEGPNCTVNIQTPASLNCALSAEYLDAAYTLSADFTAPAVVWTFNGIAIGPGLNDSIASDSLFIAQPGTYNITITDVFGGGAHCSSSVTVMQDTTPPAIVTQADTITCSFPQLLLNVSSTTPGVTYNWSGPDQFTSTLQNPPVSVAGVYHVTVTNPVNGCMAYASEKISIDTMAPGGSASGGTIGCGADSVQIHASSGTQGVLYEWSGPNEFSSSLQNPVVTDPGNYTVTIFNVSNGCVTDTVVVVNTGDSSITTCSIKPEPEACGQETHRPDRIFLGYGPQSTRLVVTAGGTGPFTYAWQPADGLSCTDCADPVFTPTQPGLYTFNVTVGSASGCTSTCSITICVLDIRAPYNRCGHGPQVYLCVPEWTCHGEVNYTVAMDDWDVENYMLCHPGCHYGSCDEHCGFKKQAREAANGDESFKTDDEASNAQFTPGNHLMDVLVYPNPFTSSFNCKITTSGTQPVYIKLFDVQGKLISEQTDVNTDNEQSFAGQVTNGVYFLEIMQGDTKQVVRIVKAD